MELIDILHLSDLHYESPDSFLDDDKTHIDEALRDSAFRNLNRMLSVCFRERPLEAVSIGGDITTQGKVAGFTQFQSEALPLLAAIVSSPKALCLVPGNHDVEWGLDASAEDYFTRKFAPYKSLVDACGATSSLIPVGGIPTSSKGTITFSPSTQGPIYIDEAKRLLVLCINSSMRCGERNRFLQTTLHKPSQDMETRISSIVDRTPADDEKGADLDFLKRNLSVLSARLAKYTIFDIPHVTHAQLDEIRRLLIEARSTHQSDWMSYLKVAIMHHHVVPFDYQMTEHKPFEMTVDASSVLETLTPFGFHLLLTGHKHQPYVQDVTHNDAQLLVVGGMTVGGYSVPGFRHGVRHIRVKRAEGKLDVGVADLPCDYHGDIATYVEDQIAKAPVHSVRLGRLPHRIFFPKRIEEAVQEQIYKRPFYRTNMVFDIEVKPRDEDSLLFTTTLSYVVVNRTELEQSWTTKYALHGGDGNVLELRFDGKDFDPKQADFRDGKGLSLPYLLKPHQAADAHVKVEEIWPRVGTTFCTSYFPATDLKVILRLEDLSIDFRFEVLYFWEVWPETKKRHREVSFEQGVLPYQGVRLYWQRSINDQQEHETNAR